jgi:hypothetical protein
MSDKALIIKRRVIYLVQTLESSSPLPLGSFLCILAFDLGFSVLISLGTSGIIFFPNGTNFWPFRNPEMGLDLVRTAWVSTSLGTPNTIPSLPIFVISILELVLGTSALSQLVLVLAPFWVSTFFLAILVSKGYHVRSNFVIVAGALVYSLNWITISQIGDFTLVYVYAAAPIVLYYSLKLFKNEGNNFWNAIGLAIGLFLGCFATELIGIVFLVPAMLIAGIYRLATISKISDFLVFGRSILFFLLAFLFYLIMSLPFTIFSILGVFNQGVLGFSTEAGFHVNQNYLQYVHPSVFMSYLPSNVSLFLLLTNPIPQSAIELLAVVVPIIAFFSIFSSDSDRRKLALSSSVLVLVLLALILLILEQSTLINTLYSKIVLLVPINGFWPYAILLGSIYGIIFPIGLETLLSFSNKLTRVISNNRKSLAKIFCLGVLMILALASILPLISNNFFPSNVTNINAYEMGQGTQFGLLSDYLPNLTNFFNSLTHGDNNFRVLYVPQVDMVNQLLLTYDPASDFQPGGLRSYTGVIEALQNLTTLLAEPTRTPSNGLAVLLAQFGFRYVVVLKDVVSQGVVNLDMSGTDAYISGSASYFIATLENSSDIKSIENSLDYAIFEVDFPDGWQPSMFFLSNTLNTTASQENNSSFSISSKTPYYSPSSYSLNLTSKGPVWLIFANNYDEQWRGTVQIDESVMSLNHTLGMGWANAFLIPGNGSRTVKLTYLPQNSYNEVLVLWPTLILGMLALVVCASLYFRKKRRSDIVG